MNWIAPLVMLLATAGASVAWWRHVRRRQYLKFEDLPLPEEAPTLAAIPLSLAQETRRKALTELVNSRHAQSNKHQAYYHDTLIVSLTSAAMAFASLAVTLTIGAGNHSVEQAGAVMGVAGLGVTIICFAIAVRANRLWIVARTSTELLRQWSMLDLVAGEADGEPESKFLEKEQTIAQRLGKSDPSQLAIAVKEIWESERALRKARLDLIESRNSPELSVYFAKRIDRQHRWFHVSRLRMSHQSEVRGKFMIGIFVATFALASADLAMVLGGLPWLMAERAYVSLGILLLLACSTFLTALFLNQNTRSLGHRYAAQERWISESRARFVQSVHSGADTAPGVGEQIAAFEQAFADELIDWIMITSHDRMEISV